eukprot:6184460-Pleurochrysis_carterae.AAC.2
MTCQYSAQAGQNSPGDESSLPQQQRSAACAYRVAKDVVDARVHNGLAVQREDVRRRAIKADAEANSLRLSRHDVHRRKLRHSDAIHSHGRRVLSSDLQSGREDVPPVVMIRHAGLVNRAQPSHQQPNRVSATLAPVAVRVAGNEHAAETAARDQW